MAGVRADAVAVTVVVAARNAAATLPATLAALTAQQLDGGYEVIVVDSGSDDGTSSVAESSPGVAVLLRNPGGEPASSRNLGAARAHGAVLAFTDADCEPAPGWLAAGLRGLERADIVQGMVQPAVAPGPFDRTLSVIDEYGLYETANLFVRREWFERVGGFQPLVAAVEAGETSPFGEDVWFAWRARRAGARTAFAVDAVVRHAVFERGSRQFLAERARSRYFPPLVSRIPELRDAFLCRRVFLSPASMRFDLALAGLVVAIAARRAPPAVLALPYGAALAREARRWPRGQRGKVAAVTVGADAVTLAALIRGSVAASTVVL
jgi:glycosyltransferase involved in cell wall biosynthesis